MTVLKWVLILGAEVFEIPSLNYHVSRYGDLHHICVRTLEVPYLGSPLRVRISASAG